ncbi:hypothetical protein CPAR01_13646, partial [Colletotrichum paranaense]
VWVRLGGGFLHGVSSRNCSWAVQTRNVDLSKYCFFFVYELSSLDRTRHRAIKCRHGALFLFSSRSYLESCALEDLGSIQLGLTLGVSGE